MRKVKQILSEFQRWQLNVSIEDGRVVLNGGDKRAREHYRNFMDEHKTVEAYIILELAKNDPDLMFEIEERAAIREADGLPGDLFSAVMCNFTN